jgi:hypothetical protein
MHYDNSSATGRQAVERLPDARSDEKHLLGVVLPGRGSMQIEFVALANCFLAPLISSDIHQHTHEPRLFIPRPARNGFQCARSLEKRFLNKIQGFVATRDKAPCKPVEPVRMRIEQGRQSVGVLWRHPRGTAGGGLFAHTSLNGRHCPNVGSGSP